MSNICNCPDPPGGQVVCEKHQMAVCVIRNGQARQQCLDPISSSNPFELVNWALTEITGENRNSFTRVSRDDIKILLDGKYRISNSRTTFSLPEKIKNAIAEIVNNRGGSDRGFERELTR